MTAANGRCCAILKSVYHWRCSRRAGPSGLCAQHYYFGASVPTGGWKHPTNPLGVVTCEPIGPFHPVQGSRDG